MLLGTNHSGNRKENKNSQGFSFGTTLMHKLNQTHAKTSLNLMTEL